MEQGVEYVAVLKLYYIPYISDFLLLEAKASLWFTPVRQLVSQSVS